MRILKAATAYFAIVIGAGFLMGMIRVPLVVPRLGERYAELLEMPLMLAVIVLAARYIVRRWQLPRRLPVRLATGVIALSLSVVAELLLAAALQGRAIGEYIASRDPVSGSVYLAMLVLFALMPAFVRDG